VTECRIISWNLLHSIGARVENVVALAQRHQPDLLLMQEATAEFDHLPQRLGGHYARLALPGRHHGLAAWSPNPLHSPAASLVLQRGLIVRRVCQIVDLGGFSVANVHLSHGQMLNRRQLRRIASALPECAAILGDCNMVGAPLLPGFRDVGARQATHRMSNIIPLRLDRCFIRGLSCISAEVLDQGASDHRPLQVVLADSRANTPIDPQTPANQQDG
jgi:endonuclease/exonuclease/phosphatase (EEP) superfamily protein YafD